MAPPTTPPPKDDRATRGSRGKRRSRKKRAATTQASTTAVGGIASRSGLGLGLGVGVGSGSSAAAQRRRAKREHPTATALAPIDAAPWRWHAVVAAIIIAATVATYWNTLHNEFLTFDDRKYIYENELVIGDGGLAAIWGDVFTPHPKLHYRPLTFTTYWLEKNFFGLERPNVDRSQVTNLAAHPIFHWDQIILQIGNALLIMGVFRLLGAPFLAYSFAAVIFAIHPVNVASVAWIAERKNLLAGIFFWASLWLYIAYRRHRLQAAMVTPPAPKSMAALPWLYAAAIVAFVLSLLAKAATLVLPPIIIITDRIIEGQWRKRALWRALPFFIFAMIAAQMTVAREAEAANSWEPIDFYMRPFIAVAALAQYVLTMFWEPRRAIIYPRWPLTLSEPRYAISLVVVAAAGYAIWRYRKQLGDLWLWALGVFVITVLPVLGLKHFIWMQFAFVSDHYLYFGAPAILLLLGLAMHRWCLLPEHSSAAFTPTPTPTPMPAPATTRAAATAWRPPYRARRLIVCLLATLVAGVAWATSTVAQNRTWKDNPSLWTHTVAISPGSDIANLNLGNHHARSGNNDKALPYYQQFARIRPDYILGWRACARAATAIGDFTAANVCYQGALKATRDKRSNPWTLHREYADALTKAGEFAAALRQQQAALAAAPQRERERDAIARSIEALTQRIAISGQSASSTHEPSASTPATSGAVAGDDAGAEAGRDVGGEP